VLEVDGARIAELALPFTIASGAETTLDVPLRRGWRTPLALRASADVPLARLRVTAPDGSTSEHVMYERAGEAGESSDTLVATLHLAPGAYSVAATAGPRHASGTLVVEPVDRDDPALVLALD
jgi:hypothetical protein